MGRGRTLRDELGLVMELNARRSIQYGSQLIPPPPPAPALRTEGEFWEGFCSEKAPIISKVVTHRHMCGYRVHAGSVQHIKEGSGAASMMECVVHTLKRHTGTDRRNKKISVNGSSL